MRIVLAPDSFKASLSAEAAAQAMADGLRAVWPQAELRLHPMADGGEGTLAAIAAARPEAQWRSTTVSNLDGRPCQARWLQLPDGVAVLESAQMLGLPLSQGCPVEQRSSLGLGQQLLAVLAEGCTRILIGLGGTGSNDGGAGLLQALGARLLDAQGQALPATPQGLARLARLDLDGLDARLAGVQLLALADVASPLSGPHGATAVFGPQKGVSAAAVAAIDASLAHLGELGDASTGRAERGRAGSGAAGGLGWALRVLGAQLEPGAEQIADLQGLDDSLRGADYLISGEGRSDLQTPLGKLPWRMAARAARQGVPAVLMSGAIAAEAHAQLATRFRCCLSLVQGEDEDEIEAAKREAASRLRALAQAWATQQASDAAR